MEKPFLGLAMMPESEFVSTILPLLNDQSVEVLEWSFDTVDHIQEPEWLSDLLDFYAENSRLLGHGVYYSLFDAQWTERQEKWLAKLKKEIQNRKYNHITEHFGFMNTENFHQGVPLPVPLNHKILRIGKDRLARLQDAAEVPVGVENLAFSFSIDDVKEQGAFLDQLVEDIDGFLILDLHNIYCQSCNFEIDILDIVSEYPLEKVKEIHLSGGSWQNSVYGKKRIRRDTHDDVIPEEIFSVLPAVLAQCPALEYVIIERLGHTLHTDIDKKAFFNDFIRTKKIIEAAEFSGRTSKSRNRKNNHLSYKPLQDELLHHEQTKLTKLLYGNADTASFKEEKFSYFNTQKWDPEMIETAKNIIKKWNPY
ncbi:MAG: DUF692 domain-containing protein [Chryseobacterium sp.]|jgi:uncharacterized protein (UPF0276 family)|uniref:MNIO family chryseobactin maturase n=1 Tax=Chryseobacterium sp. TaxID=1871047 RepID=UPI0028297634|nr:DUF692 family multinuclear iron-containing protein [Chryseobacterium sp.]MDR2234864.1 DUF692 domain-containing protein [Chryseobacterium sp.]